MALYGGIAAILRFAVDPVIYAVLAQTISSTEQQVMQFPAVIKDELWDEASFTLANTINKYITGFWLSGKANVLAFRKTRYLQTICEGLKYWLEGGFTCKVF